MNNMFRIKLSTNFPEWSLLRQTPGSKGIWDNCQFFVDLDIEECDYWVVYSGLLKPEKTICPPENTFFITGEPPTFKKYDSKFLNQFATIVTCHQDIKHPNVVHTQQGYPWHVGRYIKNGINISFSKDYDELKTIKNFSKDRLLSVISSNKDFTEGHKKRVEFVRKLAEHFSPKIDIFGRGIRDIEDKWDAISRYTYHIAIENSSFNDYWTEKLSDAFLGGAYPFYYGCPNLSDYFPPGSYTSIDINDFKKSVSIIEDAIENQQYEKSIEEITKARHLVLDKYNLFAMISDLCNNKKFNTGRVAITLKPEDNSSTNIAKRVLKWISPRI